ncbi:MAG: NTP transferase domain-containing protein [Phycisphaerales bacterium]|nr:NTP transferase domain-containing protein [Planctomycetota bacterium]
MNAIAIVLAAGRGLRMGGPKALMELNGVPWWRLQRERLAEAGVPSIWVVSEMVAKAMQGAQALPSRLVLADSSKPMFESLLTGLRALGEDPPDGVFVLPVDVPASRDPKVWEELAASKQPAAPAIQGRSGHPVFLPGAWVKGTLWPRVAGGEGPVRLDELIGGGLIQVPTCDPDVLCNLNTPEDLRLFLSAARATFDTR